MGSEDGEKGGCQTMADTFLCAQAHMYLISADKVTFMRRASAVGKNSSRAAQDAR